jgi:diguanylate cyclase (GGDEF)-like protein
MMDVNMIAKRSTQEIVLLFICAFAIVTITPFIFIRVSNQDWPIAIVDTFIVIGLITCFIFFYKTRQVHTANMVLALFAATAVIATTYIKGISQVYWVYPSMVSAYYLVPPKKAIVISAVSLILLSFILYDQVDLVNFLAIFSSITLTTSFAFVFAHLTEKKHKQLESLATIDALTSVGNRRSLDNKLAEITLAQQRKQIQMSLILIDIDHFKKVNDEFGHAIGDEILIRVSSLIGKNTRALDSLYRYGGEEFIVVPLYIELEKAVVLAEKLRSVIESSDLLPNSPVTISLGVAQYHQNETVESWISRADSALYKAKKSGRNKVHSSI